MSLDLMTASESVAEFDSYSINDSRSGVDGSIWQRQREHYECFGRSACRIAVQSRLP